MAGIEMFQKLTLQDLSRWLELHPYEVVRVLVAGEALPDDLRFTREDVDRVRAMGGIELWWSDPPAAGGAEAEAALLAGLAGQLLAREVFGRERATRFDNLLRGLDPEQQRAMRRAVQRLLKAGHLATRSSPTGLRVYAPEDSRGYLGELAAG